MNSYLQIITGDIKVLLDAAGVHEILELGETGDDAVCASGYRQWRGQALSRVSCRSLFGQKLHEAAERTGIVYSPELAGNLPVVLEADGIVRLNHLEERYFTGLPLVPRRVSAVFDKVHVCKGSGEQLFHLKRPCDQALVEGRDDGGDAAILERVA